MGYNNNTVLNDNTDQYQETRPFRNDKGSHKLSRILNQMQIGKTWHASVRFCVNQAISKYERILREEIPCDQQPAMNNKTLKNHYFNKHEERPYGF